MTRDWLSPAQAAARIGTSSRSVQRWIASGKVPAQRVGGRWRVAIDAIDALGVPPTRTTQTDNAIRRLFVANRGEIVTRISRTCDRLGVEVVVPSTDGPGAIDLLDRDAVVAAAVNAAADAVHPGFGFLAENPDFADAVIAAGMRWVGPPPAAIRAMGDKAAARRLAQQLGVPTVAGYDGDDQSDEALATAARQIGLPLLIKPSAGGGGKGMRTVRDLEGLPAAASASRREALAAFGDDRLILERLLEGPRHVEVQLLFDRHGQGIHLGDRDCSIQRRHQKVLEETPSPAVDAATRTRLTDAALALGRAVGYESAGTCEFLLDDRGQVFFLEMNARLQVEHPVTEAVTGRDLVADQLRIAAGVPLGIRQADVRPRGHAIEVRLYAEDAEAGFLPATGRVEALRWPSGEGIRVDAGVDLGTEIGGRFDPMLAKVIAHGRDRRQALARLAKALDETLILGVITNLRFLRWLIREPAVTSGQARIDSLGHVWPPDDWTKRTAIPGAAWAQAAATLAADPNAVGWRLNGPAKMRLATETDEGAVAVEPTASEFGFEGVLAGNTVHLDVGGRSVAFRIAPPPDVDRAARAAAAHSGSAGPSNLVAPMPGAVLATHVNEGDAVEAGDPIVTLEAMKMEHVVAAADPGRLDILLVKAGQQVTRGQLLAVVRPSG